MGLFVFSYIRLLFKQIFFGSKHRLNCTLKRLSQEKPFGTEGARLFYRQETLPDAQCSSAKAQKTLVAHASINLNPYR